VLARRLDYIFFERAEREAMTVDRLYTLEKLSAGVGALATNPGRLKDRIAAAFRVSSTVNAASLPHAAD
jgi:hypothetical protein